jgi:hypothetical protein
VCYQDSYHIYERAANLVDEYNPVPDIFYPAYNRPTDAHPFFHTLCTCERVAFGKNTLKKDKTLVDLDYSASCYLKL